eukprot:Tbor_TRINITY_DN3053_c0_g1::TRINITY_DN3053_c0_g1_i1::g.17415::m.17415/K18643/KATNB1; katanin p80 WD40 repeat-containing subunit B1
MPAVSSFQLPSPVLCGVLSHSRCDQLAGFGCSDKQVHVMRFGDGNVIAKLSGHVTPVTSLAFDHKRERLAAGSEGGSLRLWDLNTTDGIRTFGNSHKGKITCVDYHSVGDFIATVSSDTNLRIWDVRKNVSLQSYKGVPSEVRVCKFTPSGRWVASGCAEGVIRLYDLAAGKSIKDFKCHKGAITSIAFHPKQFLMAASSADGTISLWDCEELSLLYQSSVRTPYSAVTFGEKCLAAANEKLLRVYYFDGMSEKTAVNREASWNSVSDLQWCKTTNDILSVEVTGTSVSMSRLALPERKSLNDQHHVEESPEKHDHHKHHIVAEPFTSNQKEHRGNCVPSRPAPAPAELPISDNKIKKEALRRAEQEQTALDKVPQKDVKDAAAIVEDAIEKSYVVQRMLNRRLTYHKLCRQELPSNMRGAVSVLIKAVREGSDSGASLDFLGALQNQRLKERITLENLPDILHLVAHVLQTKKTEPALLTAIRVAKSMNTKFRSRLEELKGAAVHADTGVDLSMEARIEQSKQSLSTFAHIFSIIGPYCDKSGSVGEECRLLMSEAGMR